MFTDTNTQTHTQTHTQTGSQQPLATAKQIDFAVSIARELGWDAETQRVLTDAMRKADRKAASRSIERMIAARDEMRRQARQAPKPQPTQPTAPQCKAEANRMYRLPDGAVIRIQQGQNGLYGMRLVVTTDATGKSTGRFAYERGLKPQVEAQGRPLTQTEAAEFGATYHFCCNCTKDLSTRSSINFGYGKQCASHNGWVYLDLDTKKGYAEALERGLVREQQNPQQPASQQPASQTQAEMDADDRDMAIIEREGELLEAAAVAAWKWAS